MFLGHGVPLGQCCLHPCIGAGCIFFVHSSCIKIFYIVLRRCEVKIGMLCINSKNVEPHEDRDYDKLMIIIDNYDPMRKVRYHNVYTH